MLHPALQIYPGVLGQCYQLKVPLGRGKRVRFNLLHLYIAILNFKRRIITWLVAPHSVQPSLGFHIAMTAPVGSTMTLIQP